MKLLEEATAIMPYSDSMYFDDFNADSRDLEADAPSFRRDTFQRANISIEVASDGDGCSQ